MFNRQLYYASRSTHRAVGRLILCLLVVGIVGFALWMAYLPGVDSPQALACRSDQCWVAYRETHGIGMMMWVFPWMFAVILSVWWVATWAVSRVAYGAVHEEVVDRRRGWNFDAEDD